MRRSCPGLLTLGVMLVCPAALSCDAEPDPRVVAVQKQLHQEQRKLEDIAQQLGELERRARAARSEAEYQSCRARAGELRAEISRRRAMCAKDVADHNLCLALNSKQAADSTLAGCAIGLLLSAFSGGAAAPWALGGCALGAGAAPSPDCPSIACTDKLSALENEVLAERGLKGFPHCGGYFGLSIQQLIAKIPAAIRIERVAPGSTAQSASMAKGDALWMVAGTRVSSATEVEAALRSVTPGQVVSLQVIRGDQQLSLTGTASRRNTQGELGDSVQLGVQFGESLTDVPFEAAVQLADVDPQSPSHDLLRVGDAISAVSTQNLATEFQTVRNANELEARLEAVRSGQSVTFKVLRAADTVDAEVRAMERGQHQWL